MGEPLVRPVAVAHAHEDLTPGTAPREASAPCPTRCAGARAPNPPAPLGARLSARREPRGLRTTARPVAPTRARGALVSVSLARLGHEKVSSTLMYAAGGCRDAELSPACAPHLCPCRRSSAAQGPGGRLCCRTGGTIAHWLRGWWAGARAQGKLAPQRPQGGGRGTRGTSRDRSGIQNFTGCLDEYSM